MKIKTIARSEESFTRETAKDVHKVHRNLDPAIHPFEKPREYTRALNATKLERVFSKPFVGVLDGHIDGVFSMAKSPSWVSQLISGSCDGEIRVWHVTKFRPLHVITKAHKGFVRGLSVASNGRSFVSCSDDCTVKLWRMPSEEDGNFNYGSDDGGSVLLSVPKRINETGKSSPFLISTTTAKHALTAIDHHWKAPLYATGGAVVEVWDEHRSEPIHSFDWGSATANSVKFNPIETDLLASAAADKNIVLYDIRSASPLKKIFMRMRSNALCWNPMEAFNFTIANEDQNLYTYDMRNLERALWVHKDHVSAVLDIDYSPTGREFVSGGYDKSLRLWNVDQGKSREVYHTKRMQRIFCVKYSMDGKFVLSGSDDTNIRVWKSIANDRLGVLLPRQKQKIEYESKLKERYQHLPEIRRISKHRNLPRTIYKTRKLKEVMDASDRKKIENRRNHSKPGTVPYKSERKKHIIAKED